MYICVILRQGQTLLVPCERNITSDTLKGLTTQATLIIPLHCLWAKSNNKAGGKFECDVIWFCFCFDFVSSHARFGCCSIVCLRFHVQIKQVECKVSTKNVNNYN